MQTSPVRAGFLLKRHASWTQGDGPNYSKNLIALGIATVAGVVLATVSIHVIKVTPLNCIGHPYCA